MQPRKIPLDPARQARIVAELRRDRDLRQKGYRERALKLFPHVCARCAREFSGRRLQELTVHHKDHNHDNNPPDGRNWELLCIYCHGDEHEKTLARGYPGEGGDAPEAPSIFNPFDALDKLVKPEAGESKPPPEPDSGKRGANGSESGPAH